MLVYVIIFTLTSLGQILAIIMLKKEIDEIKEQIENEKYWNSKEGR